MDLLVKSYFSCPERCHGYNHLHCDTLHSLNVAKGILIHWRKILLQSRIEGKLLLKARCYYERSLSCRTYAAWKMFILVKIENKKQKIQALELYSRNLLSSCFKKFILRRLFFRSLKISHFLYEQIIIILSLQKKILLTTKVTFDYHFILELSDIALLLWSYNLKKQVFLTWISCMKEEVRDLKLRALKCWSTNINKRYLHIWIRYNGHRKRISEEKDFADELNKSRLIANSLSKWNLKYNDISIMKLIVNDAAILFRRRNLRMHFCYWKTYTSQVINIRSKLFQAQEFYLCYLKIKTFTKMKSYRNNKKELRQLNEVATTFKKAMYIHNYWRNWIYFLEEKESSTNQMLHKKAFLFYRRMTLSRCLKIIISYFKIRRKKADLLKKKLRFSLLLAGKIYLQKWRIKWQGLQYSDLLEKEGIAVYCYNIINRTLRMWKRRWLAYNEVSKLFCFAISYYEEKQMHSMLYKWLAWKNEKNKIRCSKSQAMVYNDRRLKLLLMNSWKSYLLLKKWKKTQYTIGENIHKNNLKRKAFCKLVAFKAFMVNQKLKAEINLTEIKMKKVDKIFNVWRNITMDRKMIENAINNFCQKQDLRMTIVYFKKWSTYILTKQRKIVIHANVKYLTASWNKEILKSFLKEWYKSYIHNQYIKQMKNKAGEHFRSNLESRTFLMWKMYHFTRKCKSMVKEKLIEVQLSCIVSRRICEWYELYSLKMSEKSRMTYSAKKWAQLTQQKVINGWKKVTEEKKAKRKQYANAAILHKKLLLEMGVILLMRESITKKEERRATYQQKYIQMSARQFQIAVKYSELWRRKLLKKPSHQSSHHKNKMEQKKISGTNCISENENNETIPSEYSKIQEEEDFKARTKPRIPYFIDVKKEKYPKNTF